MRIQLAQTLGALTEEDKDKKNQVLLELDKPEVKTALVALILNEIRQYKTVRAQQKLSKDPFYMTDYNTEGGFAKLSAWVDLLDVPAFIEARTNSPEVQEDELPAD